MIDARLEKGEIIVDSVGFMLGGYETTSLALVFATYLLATNPEAQERLANEIHEYFEENPVSKVIHRCIDIVCPTLYIVYGFSFIVYNYRTRPCMKPHMSCSILKW